MNQLYNHARNKCDIGQRHLFLESRAYTIFELTCDLK
jgi:hypothetical protein